MQTYLTKSLNFSFRALLLFVVATMALFSVQAANSAQESENPSVKANWRIVNYWSEWCAPCRVEIPMFNALRETLSDSNVIVVGVNFDEDPREVTLDIAEDLGIRFPVLTIEEVRELKLRAPDVMPTTYILSPTNEVMAKLIGMQSEQDMLEQLQSLGLSPVDN